MANVLIGIVGIVLFIGLALAGASFFGPVLMDSTTEARASGVFQVMSTVSKAVVVRDRELGTLTSPSLDSSVLVPTYLEDMPVNPVSGSPISLLTSGGAAAGGMIRYIATRLPATEAKMCGYLNKQGGNLNTYDVPVLAGFPAQASGCFRASGQIGVVSGGEYVAYMSVN